MKIKRHTIALAITAALALGQNAVAQDTTEDSAYQWGRWAVLSPAAGGEPFRAPDAPGSDFNARPSDADAFQPEIASISSPPLSQPPIVVPNPPGQQPPSGDPRDGLLPQPPMVVPNPGGGQVPGGDPRDGLLP